MRPQVAAAAPNSAAPSMPKRPARMGAQASTVPWPPDSAAEPVSRPAAGGIPSALISPTPMRFCITRLAIAIPVRMTRNAPPAASRLTRADSPTVVKNATSSVSRPDRSNLSSIPAVACTSDNASDATSPPVTGSGML